MLSGLLRSETISSFVQALQVEKRVQQQFELADKGRFLKVLLIVLPGAALLTGLAGGLYTVYTGTDCNDKDFGRYSRAFFYTSLSYTLTNFLMDKLLNHFKIALMRHPQVSFMTYCVQASIIAGFLITMAVLLGFLRKTACASVNDKIKRRLGSF